MSRSPLSRRHFLRGAGAAVALPWLGAMASSARAARGEAPRRTVFICGGLGFHAPFLFPQEAGRDYESTPYLDILAPHRGHFSLFSGLSHGLDRSYRR